MPPSKTPIGDQLEALYPDRSDRRRAGFKAAALAERLGTRSFLVDGCVGGRTVTVSGIHVDALGALVCTITHPDIPAGANPFRFVNPPLMVPGPDTVTVTSLHGGSSYEKAVPVENLVAAGREMVRQTVDHLLGGG